jgi:DNA modification methylase
MADLPDTRGCPVPAPAQDTSCGKLFIGQTEGLLNGPLREQMRGRVQLLFTSPPFPLNEKKRYGNLQGEEYVEWLASFAPLFADLLAPDGSIVMELGNAWEPKRPVQSLLPLESFLRFAQHKDAGLRLCQTFVCHNPSRLPSPAEWVNVQRARVTDSYTNIWWMSKSDTPKADNRRILRPYSGSTRRMHQRGSFNAGRRPSGHVIGSKAFLTDNGGSIMPSFIEMEPVDAGKETRLPSNVFSIAHTNSNDFYLRECKAHGITPHPARMPLQLVDFFIQFLTEPGDLVLDPFAGSNATGYCAERGGRRWVSFEAREEYAEHSSIRFSESIAIEGTQEVGRSAPQ